MSENKKLIQMQKRIDSLRKKLAETGLLLQGTIAERNIQRGTGSKKKNYGPYYQWTFKKDGKTVTVNLAAGQAGEFQKAIDNNKETEDVMEEMRSLSRDILELSTPGVIRRKGTKQAQNNP